MYRSLNIETLGISGRQSELLELALTYRFKGIDLDMESFVRQADKRGQEHASRFLASARKSSVGLQIGTWRLPVRWQGPDDVFREDLQRLPAIANIAKSLGAHRCVTDVMAGSDSLPLQENFEFHRQRFAEIAELLAPHDISLGLGFQAAKASRADLAHQFIVTAESLVTLMKSVAADNVGLLIDTWNWHLGGGTVAELAELPARKIVSVRVADIPAGATADSIELKQRLLPSPQGTVPVAEILAKLSDMEYDGPVAPFPHVSIFKGITRDNIVQRTADALRGVWPGREMLEEEQEEAVVEDSSKEANQEQGDEKANGQPSEKAAATS